MRPTLNKIVRKPLIVTFSLVCTLMYRAHVNTNDQINACMCENDVEGVKRSLNSFNCYSCYSSQKGQKWCLWLLHNTVYRVMLLMFLMLKGLKCTLYRASHPSKGEGYLFEKPSILWV